MRDCEKEAEKLRFEFGQCQRTFTALGDENRQHLLCMMLGAGRIRAVELAERTNLSRPAVSHHLQILKDAGIVKSRKEGTFIYYYLDPSDSETENMITLFSHIRSVMKNVPDRGRDEKICL